MNDEKVGEHSYQVGKLGAMDQLLVGRRLSNVLAVLAHTRREDKAALSDTSAMARAMCMLSADMPTNEVNEAVFVSLACVKRKVGTEYAQVVNNNQLMYQDLKLEELLALVWLVVRDNGIMDFFSVPRSELKGGGKKKP